MVVLRILIQVHSAFGTKPCTVFLTHRLEWQRGHHCIPKYRLEINMIIDNPALVILFVILGQVNALVVEEFLDIGFEVIRDGLQAPSALTVNFNSGDSGNQDTLVHGLEPQIQVDFRPFLNADECYAQFSWRSDLLIEDCHTSRAAPEILGRKDQGRTAIDAA